jgi:hypothetical protein
MRILSPCVAFLTLCIAISTPGKAETDASHELEVLRENAAAGLMICQMTTRSEFLSAQMQASDMGKVESVRWQCAKEQERRLEPHL